MNDKNAVMSTIVTTIKRRITRMARYRKHQNKKIKPELNTELIFTAAKFSSMQSELLNRRVKQAQDILKIKKDNVKKIFTCLIREFLLNMKMKVPSQ